VRDVHGDLVAPAYGDAVPFQEAKLVLFTRGAIHDVVIDLRLQLRTFKGWIGRF
jgi:dTDP-4-dehydrorhamnose 3,5-epimerase-like enzyme